MAATSTRDLAIPRGLVVGLLSGLGATTAHLLGGGHVAVVEALVVTTLAAAAGMVLARVSLGIGVLALVASGSQAVFHLLMSGPSHAEMTMGAAGGPGAAAMVGTETPALMLLTHAVVAVVTVALALGADRALLDLARGLTRWILPRATSFRAPEVPARARWTLDVRVLPLHRHLTSPASRRGPPSSGRLVLQLP